MITVCLLAPVASNTTPPHDGIIVGLWGIYFCYISAVRKFNSNSGCAGLGKDHQSTVNVLIGYGECGNCNK